MKRRRARRRRRRRQQRRRADKRAERKRARANCAAAVETLRDRANDAKNVFFSPCFRSFKCRRPDYFCVFKQL